jgi:hypothetical protein
MEWWLWIVHSSLANVVVSQSISKTPFQMLLANILYRLLQQSIVGMVMIVQSD